MAFKNLALALLVSTTLAGCTTTDNNSGGLKKVASFDHQVTGVTVSKDNRLFVNFPRWTEDAPVSVAEVKNGVAVAYPNVEWNSWRNSKKNELVPSNYFICVQSVVVDHANNLWVVDAAAPANDKVVPGGAKLVKINLANDQVEKVIVFNDKVAPASSYLNDVRFSPDDRFAYLTDSSAKGGIIVVDLKSGSARRALDGVKETQPEKDVKVTADGKPLRRPDGRGVEFASDGIALSADGRYLYWQALTGRTLYRVPTVALQDANLPAATLREQVMEVGKTNVADGLLMDKNDNLYITSPEDNSVKKRDANGQISTVVRDERLRWPDTLAQGVDGAVYVTGSHIQDSKWFKEDAPVALPTELWRF